MSPELALCDSPPGAGTCPKLGLEQKPPTLARTDTIDPGCVKTTSQIEIVSGFSETIDATVH